MPIHGTFYPVTVAKVQWTMVRLPGPPDPGPDRDAPGAAVLGLARA